MRDPDLRFQASVEALLLRAARRWYVVLVGAVSGGFGAANELFAGGGLKMPGWVGWSLLALSILIALFWGFHDERIAKANELAVTEDKRLRLEAGVRQGEETRARRISIERELWAAEIERQFILHDEDPLSAEEKNRFFRQWRKATGDYLSAILGPASAARLYAHKDGSVINEIAYGLDLDHVLLDLDGLRAAGQQRREAAGITKDGKFVIRRTPTKTGADGSDSAP